MVAKPEIESRTVETPVPAWSLSFQPCVALPGGDRVRPDG